VIVIRKQKEPQEITNPFFNVVKVYLKVVSEIRFNEPTTKILDK